MDNIKDDKYYAQKALNNILAIEKYVLDISYDQFISDDELIDAVMFRFIQLVENIKNISDEFKEQNSNIPWRDIIGFRNGIVHEYGNTDYVIVYETAVNDLKDLKIVFEKLL